MDNLRNSLKNYSFDDLAKGLFALNLYLPNIASPIKSQYLYTLLEEICDQLPENNKIKTYKDFAEFCEKVIKLTPSFPTIEDYVPEEDWGDIKYFYKKRFYKIFYGGDLSNPYEFYYSFEIIHAWFEDYYLQLIKRWPFTEFQFVLELQDYILRNLQQDKQENTELRPGDFITPTEDFWNSVVVFINSFQPENLYSRDLLNLYTYKCGIRSEKLSIEKFAERAFEGKNCQYLFLEKRGRYYPVLPRRYFSVILDEWGKILKDKYTEILKLEKLQGKKPEYGIYVALIKFLKTRFKEDEVFEFASPMHLDTRAQGTVFAAIRSKKKLFMIHVTPPSVSKKILEEYLKELGPKLAECKKLLQASPTRLALLTRNTGIQFVSKSGEDLEPRFLVVVPYCTTDVISYSIPKDFEADVIGLDQFVGLMDEIINLGDLSDFFDYVDEITSSAKISGLTSYLDLYGSYKDSHGVLIPGANKPDFIMLDFGWGSGIRFRTLKNFWKDFPENDFFGHPMSWLIPEKGKTKHGFTLESRTYFGYAYFQRVGKAVFYINAPVHRMKFQQGKVTDSLMHALVDSLELYVKPLDQLSFCKVKNKVQIIFFPASLVKVDEKLKHVRHLLQDGQIWKMDITRLSPKDYGVRVVFNEDALLEALNDVRDRSLQISLLVDVLRQMNIIWPEAALTNVEVELEKEKTQKPRFKTMKVDKRVAYPEAIKPLLPENKEFKLADKTVANFAHELGIEPGTYSDDDAKVKLDGLTDKLVKEIDTRVSQYNLEKSLPLLLGKIDALIAEHERDEVMVKISLDHEVDYQRAVWSSEKYQKFFGFYKSYRYLVEKFVQHQSKKNSEISDERLKELVALVDRFLDMRAASDFLYYGIYPSKITIDRDFIITINYSVDIDAMQDKFSEEQAKLRLGEIGIDIDTADIEIPIEEYLNELNDAFKKDFGFEFRDLVNVQQILALWPVHYKDAKEDVQYSATLEEITKACAIGIKGFDESRVPAIVDFLELKPQNLLRIEGRVDLAKDLPTWEHNKRLTRYSMRPLIKIENKYHWGPHSADRTSRTWINTTSNHRLPAEIPNAPNVSALLLKGHRSIEKGLVKKAEEVVRRFTSHVETQVQPHKIDKDIDNNRYGDYDVLAYIKDKNILLNIESKIVDPDYSLKDLQSTQRNIFFGRTRSDGSFQKPDLQRVEERATYLEKECLKIMSHFGWQIQSNSPRIVSIFLTKMGYWWTKFPPVPTSVNFIQIKLLDNFLRNL